MAVVVGSVFFLLLQHYCLMIIPLSAAASDEESLLQLKKAITDNNNALNSWAAGSSPCKNKWVGAVCSDDVITGLHLSDLGLSGNIDVQTLESIPTLRTISLVNNSFSGSIPEFNRLGALKALYLSYNNFSGDIPSEYFTNMASLKKIWLSENSFSGMIPASVAGLKNLIELHLEGNQFSGNIPEMDLPKVGSLNVSNNKLEGEIPAKLVKFGKDAFNGNDLCGEPLDRVCEIKGSNMADTNTKSRIVTWVVLGLMGVAIVVVAVYSTRSREEVKFTVLGKEKVHEVIDVHVSGSSRHSSRGSGGSSKKSSGVGGSSSSSKRRFSSSRGNKKDELMMVNVEKGVFGLSDLMKAAAEVLGSGGLGSAYKAVMGNGVAVVVKRFREMNTLNSNEFDAEMRRIGNLRHPNIMTPLAYHFREEEKLLVSQYAANSSLLYMLHGDRGVCHAQLTWPTRLTIIQGIARGLGFLHTEFSSYDLPHGNLKSSNVLLNENYEPLLCDYAFHPLINPTHSSQAFFAYKAPESIQNNRRQISPKCDVYCLGVIILEVLTGKFPSQYLNNGNGGTDIVQWVKTAILENREDQVINPEIASAASSSRDQMVRLLHIGASCTESDPGSRIDLREAIRSIEEVQA